MPVVGRGLNEEHQLGHEKCYRAPPHEKLLIEIGSHWRLCGIFRAVCSSKSGSSQKLVNSAFSLP